MKTIVFTGGGTAGHIMPNIAIMEELKNRYKIYYIGSSGMEKNIISKYQYVTFLEIPSVKFNRSLTPKNLLIPFKLISCTKQAVKHLKAIQPSVVFSKGGYVSLPTALGASMLKIPIITHESDLTLGLANKIISKVSKVICCSFQPTAQNVGKKGKYTGSPIRKKIINGNKNVPITKHKIDTSRPTILIIGGSQGSQAINNVIWDNIPLLTNQYNIIHIVGKKNLRKDIVAKNYFQLEFVDDIENYLALADIAISRAGSNTIFELIATNTPMILIPLPKTKASRGDQVDNAKYFADKGLAIMIEQHNMNINTLINKINDTLSKINYYKTNLLNSDITAGNKEIINIIESYCK